MLERFRQIAKWPALYFTVKGVVFGGLAAFGVTALPPMILAGLSLTWFVLGIGLFRMIRYAKQPHVTQQPVARIQPREGGVSYKDAA